MEATYQPLAISPQTSVSFRYADVLQLAATLQAHGYTVGHTYQHEHAGLRNVVGAIAIPFESGSVLAQGSNTGPLLDLLRGLYSATELDLFGSDA